MTFIALFLPTLLGFLILALALRNDEDTGLLFRLGMSYPLGAGILTFQIFITGLCRIPLTLINLSAPVALEIVLLALWLLKNKTPLAPRITVGWTKELVSHETHFAKKAAIILFLGWAALKIVSIFVETGLRPIYAWDAWANWSVGAKLFYSTHSLMLDAPHQDFFGQGAVIRITAYPLHNPLMQLWLSLWNGGFDEVLVKFWTPPYLLALAVCLYLYASKELGRLASAALLVIFLSSPLMSYHAVEAYSDFPLAGCFFFASLAVLQALRGRPQFWLLAGLFSAEALFIKDEALFFVAPLILSAGTYLWLNTEDRAQRRTAFMKLFFPFILILPWYAFKFSHALGLGAGHVKLEFTYHPEIVIAVVQSFLTLDNFNVLFIFLPVLLVLSGKPGKELLYIGLPVACYAMFFLALYAFTTFFFDHFTKGTIFYRNLLTYYPVVAIFTVLLIKQIQTNPAPSPPIQMKKRKKHR